MTPFGMCSSQLVNRRVLYVGTFRNRNSTVVVCSGEAPKDPKNPQPQPKRTDTGRSRKGKMFEDKKRRKGRPAYLRSPYDSPLRDGNRDRLIGFLTERAAKTLLCYLMETNVNVYHWLTKFYMVNPIPKNGNWDDVSGETFLRKLLSMPVECASVSIGDPMYEICAPIGVDPRSIAQRIMEIRSQLALEFIQDLGMVSEENAHLYRETLTASLSNMLSEPDVATVASNGGFVHPELLPSPSEVKAEEAKAKELTSSQSSPQVPDKSVEAVVSKAPDASQVNLQTGTTTTSSTERKLPSEASKSDATVLSETPVAKMVDSAAASATAAKSSLPSSKVDGAAPGPAQLPKSGPQTDVPKVSEDK